MMATVLAPDDGRLRLLGWDPHAADERLAIRRRLGYMPQEPGFHRSFTAFEFVDYVAILKEMTDRRARHDEVRRVLDAVGLEAVSGRKIKALSGGMRRRVALAQALLGDPDLLVLDEPTAGLDPEQRLRFRELVSDRTADRTVMLSTHQTEDVAALCQRVVVMLDGQVLFEGTPGELTDVAEGRVWLADARAAERAAVVAHRERCAPQHRRGARGRRPRRAHPRGRLPAARRRSRLRGGGRLMAASVRTAFDGARASAVPSSRQPAAGAGGGGARPHRGQEDAAAPGLPAHDRLRAAAAAWRGRRGRRGGRSHDQPRLARRRRRRGLVDRRGAHRQRGRAAGSA